MNIVDSLEALLFIADAPATIESLAIALGLTEGQVAQGIEVLEARLEDKGSLKLTKIAGGYQLCTKPEYAELIARFLKPQGHKLGRGLMEVLAIIAYKQPITMAEIDQIRGVQSDYGCRVLVERRLVKEVGRKQTPGRPILLGTTREFLHQFNLNDLGELPKLDEGEELPTSLFEVKE
jgi:segregation and condensation protein B